VHTLSEYEDASAGFASWVESSEFKAKDFDRILAGLKASHERDYSSLRPGQEPTLVIPGLSSRPWWIREQFEWSDGLMSSCQRILAELSEFTNASASPPSISDRNVLVGHGAWSTVQLVNRGALVANTERFAATCALLSDVPGALSCGMTFFSVLHRSSSIKPHTGFTNAHLRAHLVLKEATGARFRVGSEWREWKLGDLLVFDDTFEHEAVNEGTEPRIVLLFDFWHPDLSAHERLAIDWFQGFLRKRASREHLLGGLSS
jgi:aspartyl/asparaginyl beta-hydroxylase (cupin superfamily)